MNVKGDIRQRARQAMRAELAEAAFELIRDKGYEAVTADELAAWLGISRATFFRQLGSKEEAVIAALIGPSTQFADAYRAAASGGAVSGWTGLCHAFAPAAELARDAPKSVRARIDLIKATPVLWARLRRARMPQREALAAALVEQGHDPFEADVLATAGMAVLDRCWAKWAEKPGASLADILERAFAALAAQPGRPVTASSRPEPAAPRTAPGS